MRAIKELSGVLGESGGERGVVLVTALLVMLVLLPLGAAFVAVSLTETTIASNEVGTARGFSLAEAGIEHAKKRLESLNLSAVLDGTDGVFGQGLGKGQGAQKETLTLPRSGGGKYTVLVSNNLAPEFPRGSIGTDPSGDPNVDSDRIVVVSSTGTVQGVQQTIETVMQIPRLFPAIPGAMVQVSNGWNDLDVNGTISGFDESGTCGDQAGHVAGSGTIIIEGSTVDGNPPSRDYDSAIDDPIWNDPDQVVAMIQEWMNDPAAVTITGQGPPAVLGTAANPQITVWDPAGSGSSNSSDSFTGYGILIIDHDASFDLQSPFEFHGLIVSMQLHAGGQEALTFQGGGQILHGAVLAANNHPSPSGEATEIGFNGGAQVDYNCDALTTYAGQAVGGGGGVTVLSWKQQ